MARMNLFKVLLLSLMCCLSARAELAPRTVWQDIKIEKPTGIQKSSVVGKGPIPVVIIAELGCDENTYADFADRNADKFTTYTLVLPGTRPDTRPFALDRGQVRDPLYWINAIDSIAAYIQEKKIEKPLIIGHGFAGTAAYMMAVKYPELARGYVIVNALPAPPVGETGNIPAKEMRAADVDKYQRQVVLGMDQNAWRNRARQNIPSQTTSDKRSGALINTISESPASVARRYILESLYMDLRDDLARTKAPLLVFGSLAPWLGDRDRDLIRASFQNIGFVCPSAQVVLLEKTPQWFLLDDPEKFDPVVLKFAQPASEKPAIQKQEDGGTK